MIESHRLDLRLIELRDAAFLMRLMNTPKWLKHIGDRNIKSIQDAENYIQDRMHPDLEMKGFVNYVMTEKMTGKSVGTCSLHNRRGVDGIDIGYAILEEFEGLGYASEGAKKMIELAKNSYNQAQVYAITTQANIGSCTVLERLGFQFQKTIQLPYSTENIQLYMMDI